MLAHVEFILADQSFALSRHICSTDVDKAFERRHGRGKVQHLSRTVYIHVPGLLQRVVKAHGCSAVNHPRRLRSQVFQGRSIQAAVGLAHVTGINLHALRVRRFCDRFRALHRRLAGTWADEQGKPGVWLTLEQFTDHLHAQKARCAGHQDQFFLIHVEASTCARFTCRPLRNNDSRCGEWRTLEDYIWKSPGRVSFQAIWRRSRVC